MAEDMSELSRDVLVVRLTNAEARMSVLEDALSDRSERIEELEMRIEELERGNVQTDERYTKKD